MFTLVKSFRVFIYIVVIYILYNRVRNTRLVVALYKLIVYTIFSSITSSQYRVYIIESLQFSVISIRDIELIINIKKVIIYNIVLKLNRRTFLNKVLQYILVTLTLSINNFLNIIIKFVYVIYKLKKVNQVSIIYSIIRRLVIIYSKLSSYRREVIIIIKFTISPFRLR